MKKVLLFLAVSSSSLCFADRIPSGDCSRAAGMVASKLAAHSKTAVTIDYSADNAAIAKTCQQAIQKQNSALTVTLNQDADTKKTGEFEFKPTK